MPNVFAPFWIYQLIYLPFVFALGAIVGSFLNVVIYRVPAGLSVVSPPSSCPRCGHRLPWHENLPIVGWLRLGGKCSQCRQPISVQYPLVELLCALFFTLTFVLYYMVLPTAPVVGGLVPAYLERQGFGQTWPVWALHMTMFMALLAMSIIDARTFTVPIQLTWVVTISAFLLHALMPLWPGGNLSLPLQPHGRLMQEYPGGSMLYPGGPEAHIWDVAQWTIPLVGPVGFGVGVGALLGIGVSTLLLRANLLRVSFLDFDFYVGQSESIIAYPHARREVEWELDYLSPILLGMIAGGLIGRQFSGADLPLWAASLGGSIQGYLVGAGIIWATRIIFTLLFGKEAMGLGDAHILGCIGAVLGWIDPILIFFASPFFALAGVAATLLLRSLFKGSTRVLPFGPWLAVGTLAIVYGDRWVEPFLGHMFRVWVFLP